MTWSPTTLVSAWTQPSFHNLWSLGFWLFSRFRLFEQSGVSGALQDETYFWHFSYVWTLSIYRRNYCSILYCNLTCSRIRERCSWTWCWRYRALRQSWSHWRQIPSSSVVRWSRSTPARSGWCRRSSWRRCCSCCSWTAPSASLPAGWSPRMAGPVQY